MYDIIKGKTTQSFNSTGKNNYRKTTDISQYAEAVFAGGVFKKGQPGQSL